MSAIRVAIPALMTVAAACASPPKAPLVRGPGTDETRTSSVAAREAPAPPESVRTSTTGARAELEPSGPPGGARLDAPSRSPAPGPERVCREVDEAALDAAFARRYRRQHCPLCSPRAEVEPIRLPGRRPAPRDLLERTAAGLRGRRQQLVLYYFMIPCAPCDALLPYVKEVLANRTRSELEVVPVMDTIDEQLADPEVRRALDEKFPAALRNLSGIYRDRAPFGEGWRKVERGAPATVVFSGPDLSKVRVLYGDAQTRFWKRAAAQAR